MNEYPKIQTVYLRDPETKFKTLLLGQYAEPEFAYLAENEWVFTEKVDGTNIRVMIPGDNGRPYFGGKTDNAQIPAFLVEKLEARFLPQADLLREIFPDGGCLYGEGYGARIKSEATTVLIRISCCSMSRSANGGYSEMRSRTWRRS